MKRHIILLITTLALVTALACQATQPFGAQQGEQPRTYYESLNLETPEDAVKTFSDAFQRDDFMTVFLVLSAEAQMGTRSEFVSRFTFEHLIDIDEEDTRDFIDDLDMRDTIDVQIDYWYVFDRIMLKATEDDRLLIDLHGDLTITGSEDAETFRGDDANDVITEVEGVRGDVTFRTVRDPERRWRVYQVSAPREGVESWPWTTPDREE